MITSYFYRILEELKKCYSISYPIGSGGLLKPIITSKQTIILFAHEDLHYDYLFCGSKSFFSFGKWDWVRCQKVLSRFCACRVVVQMWWWSESEITICMVMCVLTLNFLCNDYNKSVYVSNSGIFMTKDYNEYTTKMI